jgi:hypothetical protein
MKMQTEWEGKNIKNSSQEKCPHLSNCCKGAYVKNKGGI